MADRFNEEFVLVGAGGVPVDAGVNPWQAFDQVVCSLDAVKPIRSRTGWSPERVSCLQRSAHSGRLSMPGWDLVVIDEAHHVAGSSEDVARHQLGRCSPRRRPDCSCCLPRRTPGSPTPSRGCSPCSTTTSFTVSPSTGQPSRPLVVRTEKRHATDNDGRPLFRPRTTILSTVPYGERTVERSLYEAVTDYVRNGYRRAQVERRPAVGFLVLLMQRLVSSSTAAILAALERRLVAVTAEASSSASSAIASANGAT